jgi:hypothetical protein
MLAACALFGAGLAQCQIRYCAFVKAVLECQPAGSCSK